MDKGDCRQPAHVAMNVLLNAKRVERRQLN
jgi:hypothetical protein